MKTRPADIVDRLRFSDPHDWSDGVTMLCAEAADEIDRLRAALREVADNAADNATARRALKALA